MTPTFDLNHCRFSSTSEIRAIGASQIRAASSVRSSKTSSGTVSRTSYCQRTLRRLFSFWSIGASCVSLVPDAGMFTFYGGRQYSDVCPASYIGSRFTSWIIDATRGRLPIATTIAGNTAPSRSRRRFARDENPFETTHALARSINQPCSMTGVSTEGSAAPGWQMRIFMAMSTPAGWAGRLPRRVLVAAPGLLRSLLFRRPPHGSFFPDCSLC